MCLFVDGSLKKIIATTNRDNDVVHIWNHQILFQQLDHFSEKKFLFMIIVVGKTYFSIQSLNVENTTVLSPICGAA